MTFAEKKYDQARLDVVAHAATGPILLIGPAEVADYLGRETSTHTLEDLPEARTFGGAVLYDAVLTLDAEALRSVVERIGKMIAPGTALFLNLFEDPMDKAALTSLLEQTGLFDLVRVEARRPYLFEESRTRLFATARRSA